MQGLIHVSHIAAQIRSPYATSFYCAAFVASLQLAVLFQDVRQLTVNSVGLMHHLAAVATEPTGVQ
jgi:hypothetical protein